MFFVLERVRKILEELEGYVYSEKVRIDNFKMKHGNYTGIDDVDASECLWQDFNYGSKWGGKDAHFWFRSKIRIPKSFAGKKVAVRISTGQQGWDAINPQFLVYIDGILMQGADVNHREITITESAEPEKEYQLDLHAYSGMIEAKVDLLVDLVTIDLKIQELYYNILVPLKVVENLPEDDMVRINTLSILNDTINLIDLRKPYSKLFYESIDEANLFIIKEFYEGKCGHEDVIATCIGHTHIDVAWLWTLAQTREKVARSFSTVLKLMEEYPEYVFMSSQPQLYKFIKEDHPDLYEKIKEKVKQGRWEPEGAMWVEADCNLSSGESLVRQILFGTRFFENEFGVSNHVLWLPDVFGYSAALPQILKKSDIDYFMTTKIAWNQFNKLPYDTFMWKGIDGTEVLTHFITTKDYEAQPKTHFTTYNGNIVPSQVMGAWQRYQQKNINNDVLISYGYGDGGGGPTKRMLENARRMAKGIPGCPKVKMGRVYDYFKRLENKVMGNKYLPKWVGELYLEYHRGTYTSMGRNKRYNRKCEFLYQDVEFLSSLSMMIGNEYPQQTINHGWEIILLNQFHDIIPGSSIKEVYDDSKIQYEKILSEGKNLLHNLMDVITDSIELSNTSIIAYNTLSFKRNDVVVFDLPENYNNPCIIDSSGEKSICQVFEQEGQRKALFYAKDLPPKGYRAYKLVDECAEKKYKSLKVNAAKLENQFFSIKIDDKGTLSSIYDKINKREVLKDGERANKLLAFEDKPMNWDNWDIDIFYQEKMWEVDEVESVEIIEQGPVRGGIKIRKRFINSVIIQKIYIYNDIPRIDFDTYIDWKEDQILLKAAFPVEVNTDKATFDIQFGNVERPTHCNTSWDIARFEVCAHKWADASEDGYGVSLLNDCKYGYDIKDGVMRLTLLKSGIEPNKQADREEHHFVYSLYPHAGDWRDAGTVHMAYNLNVPLYAKTAGPHKGVLPQELSTIKVDCENVILETIKKAEDSNDIIIRLYECYNRRSEVEITFYKELDKVVECNLMEKELSDVPFAANSFNFTIKPYEIKTFKLKLKNA